jgi:hypothetical protein
VCFCEHGNELLVSVILREILDQLTNCQFPKNDFAPWNYYCLMMLVLNV